MPTDALQIVFFSPNEEPQVKVVTGLRSSIGGVGVAAKLYQDYGALSLAIGPLTGTYPATSVLLIASSDGLQSFGSALALEMATKGIFGAVAGSGVALEDFLLILAKFLAAREELPIIPANQLDYEILYQEILARVRNLWFSKGTSPQNCPTCPLACGKSLTTLSKVNLAASLGACQIAAGIYNDQALAFAALQALGYDYTHEELEVYEETGSR